MNLLQPAREFRHGDVGLLLYPGDHDRFERPELTAAGPPPPTARLGRAGGCTRADSFTAQLGLTPNRRAASRRDKPSATAATTRDRRSIE